MKKLTFLASIGFGALALASPATANEAVLKEHLTAECVFTPESPDNCARVIGCIGEEGAYYFGRAVGWENGTFSGSTSEGATCSGEFSYRSFLDMGKSTMECDNGETAVLTFFSRSESDDLSVGQGRSDKDRRILIWAGPGVIDYLQSVKENGKQGLICGGKTIPLE